MGGNADELTLPGLLFVPERPSGATILHLHGESMKTDAAPGGPIEKLVKRGHVVLAAELSGIGETETGLGKRDYGRGRFGRDSQEIYLAYLLGESFVGMRVRDVFRWSDCLKQIPVAKRTGGVRLVASGEAAIPALHAAALEPDRFGSVDLQGMIRSWADVAASPVNQNQLVNAVHGALRHYDLPDLIGLVGTERVAIREPVNAVGERIEPE